MKLPITIIGLGTGLSFSYYGPAGHGVIDIGLMRMLPEIKILNPADPISAKKFAQIAYKSNTPVYVRLHKAQDFPIYNVLRDFTVFLWIFYLLYLSVYYARILIIILTKNK